MKKIKSPEGERFYRGLSVAVVLILSLAATASSYIIEEGHFVGFTLIHHQNAPHYLIAILLLSFEALILYRYIKPQFKTLHSALLLVLAGGLSNLESALIYRGCLDWIPINYYLLSPGDILVYFGMALALPGAALVLRGHWRNLNPALSRLSRLRALLSQQL